MKNRNHSYWSPQYENSVILIYLNEKKIEFGAVTIYDHEKFYEISFYWFVNTVFYEHNWPCRDKF